MTSVEKAVAELQGEASLLPRAPRVVKVTTPSGIKPKALTVSGPGRKPVAVGTVLSATRDWTTFKLGDSLEAIRLEQALKVANHATDIPTGQGVNVHIGR